MKLSEDMNKASGSYGQVLTITVPSLSLFLLFVSPLPLGFANPQSFMFYLLHVGRDLRAWERT